MYKGKFVSLTKPYSSVPLDVAQVLWHCRWRSHFESMPVCTRVEPAGCKAPVYADVLCFVDV